MGGVAATIRQDHAPASQQAYSLAFRCPQDPGTGSPAMRDSGAALGGEWPLAADGPVGMRAMAHATHLDTLTAFTRHP